MSVNIFGSSAAAGASADSVGGGGGNNSTDKQIVALIANLSTKANKTDLTSKANVVD